MHWAFIRAAFASVARLAIVPLQDMLGLGTDARMNTPSRSDGNWGWQFSAGALREDLARKLASLSELCDRATEISPADQQSEGEVREEFVA
jgi:4-alpha-glucanotransferase